MAVLTIPNMQQQYALKNPVIYVEKGDDKIFSHIQGHERWRSNINYDGITESFKKKSLAFLFSDRGLYKPGEKIKFKGITRELTKDGLKIPNTKISCKELFNKALFVLLNIPPDNSNNIFFGKMCYSTNEWLSSRFFFFF